MPALALDAARRSRLRADAHHLQPTVIVGHDGATEAVRREIDAALAAHGLVKVRVADDDRMARERLLGELADALSAAPVQLIGRLIVLWRPPVERDEAVRNDRGAGPKIVKVVSFSKSGNHRPQVKRVKVLGNMRLTPGAKLKRAAKKRPASLKKRAQSA